MNELEYKTKRDRLDIRMGIWLLFIFFCQIVVFGLFFINLIVLPIIGKEYISLGMFTAFGLSMTGILLDISIMDYSESYIKKVNKLRNQKDS